MNKNIKKILIKTKKGVFSHQIGNNSSKFKGDGYDFVELREYEEGEDIRKIDWVISAKQQKPFVKVFHTQRELNIAIVPILNGTTYFGTKKLKKELITEICSMLGFASVASGDNFTSFIMNEKLQLNTKRSKKIYSVEKMTENIYNYNPLNKGLDYRLLKNELFKALKEKSIIFLIGDFFDIQQLDLKLLSAKHEVVAIVVRDIFEEKPAALGSVNFTDPQNGKIFDAALDSSLIKEYEKKVRMNDNKLYEHFKKSGVEFTKIYTHENYFVKILKLFK